MSYESGLKAWLKKMRWSGKEEMKVMEHVMCVWSADWVKVCQEKKNIGDNELETAAGFNKFWIKLA